MTARAAVRAEVDRAVALARRLPAGPATESFEQLARFLAARCGADEGDARLRPEPTGGGA